MVTGFLKEGLGNSIMSKFGYLLAKRSLESVFKKSDPRLYNGAMLIGLNGVVVKSHGGTDDIGFANAINVAISLVRDKINDTIITEVRSSVLDIENDEVENQ
jgi:glycerol-3-phosphate acyltransferase PlsX